jgi:hypothetical protein
MNATRQLKLSAPFDIEACGNGLWRLRARQGAPVVVYLRGFSPPPQWGQCTALTIDWPEGGGAVVGLSLPSEFVTIRAASATAHESLPRLYGALPLAAFDARSRRFWRAVFLLIRLPGGRRLLGRLAARRRGGA